MDGEGRINYFLGSQVDVTQRKEEALQQQSRLDTVATLASGISHEFTALMSSVVANIGQAQGAAVDARQREWLEQADHAARRAGRLTQQMLDFTNRQVQDTQAVDLNETVRDLDSLLAQTAGAAVDVRLDLSHEAAVARLDPGQLELALVHIVRNAADAMPQGGKVNVRVWDYRSWDSAAKQRGRGWVEVAVTDEGEGMAPQVAERAVEPLFSTKESGKGIGLYLAQSFVEQAGGRMQIETSPGRGTTVRLAFPRIE